MIGAGARWVELPAPPAFRPVTANPIDEWFPHYFRAMSAIYPVLLDRTRAAIADGGGAQRAADVLLSRAPRGA